MSLRVMPQEIETTTTDTVLPQRLNLNMIRPLEQPTNGKEIQSALEQHGPELEEPRILRANCK